MDNPILYIVLAVFAGVILGKLDTVFTGKLKKGREEKKEQALQQEIERLTQALEQVKKQAKEQASAPQPEKKSALKIAQSQSGEWIVEIDGVPTRPDTISAEQRSRLIGVLTQVRPLVEARPASSKSTGPLADSKPAASAPAAPPPVIRTSPLSADAFPPPPPRINPLRGVRNMLANDIKKETAPSLSIIGLIDEILQQKLQVSPLAGKSIKMEEGPMGEVLVHVGAVRHSGIDSVPDPILRAIIQEAIEEFNRTR
ncbi:MAG: hypothetical protein R6W69_01465 [Anaerolineales bacterium]